MLTLEYLIKRIPLGCMMGVCVQMWMLPSLYLYPMERYRILIRVGETRTPGIMLKVQVR